MKVLKRFSMFAALMFLLITLLVICNNQGLSKQTTIQTDDYIARLSHDGCATIGCQSHVVIEELTKSEEAMKNPAETFFLFACDIKEEDLPHGDGTIDNLSHYYVPENHPFKMYTLEEVQAIYNQLLKQEAAEREVAKHANPHGLSNQN